jgi:hypothetical protein
MAHNSAHEDDVRESMKEDRIKMVKESELANKESEDSDEIYELKMAHAREKVNLLDVLFLRTMVENIERQLDCLRQKKAIYEDMLKTTKTKLEPTKIPSMGKNQ